MQRTRWQILETLKTRGPSTLDELAKSIGLVAPTVRVHLSVLQRDSLVTAEEVRGRVGRPHFLYSLTEAAQELFPRGYDRLARRVLDEVQRQQGEAGLTSLLSRMAETWAKDHAARLEGKDLEERVATLAEIRREEGAMAEWSKTEDGYVLREFNCPSYKVACYHSELCAAEERYLSLALGVPLERLDNSAKAGHSCAFLVRAT